MFFSIFVKTNIVNLKLYFLACFYFQVLSHFVHGNFYFGYTLYMCV